MPQCLDQKADPFGRIAEDQRRSLAGEDFHPEGLASQCAPIHLCHGQGQRVQFGGRIELRQGPLPGSLNGQQLEEENPQLGVGRAAAHLLLQLRKGLIQLAVAENVLSGHKGT